MFDKYEGFEPSKLYPGYVNTAFQTEAVLMFVFRFSQDFFDGQHQVVVSIGFEEGLPMF